MNIQLPRENWCRILLLELIRKKLLSSLTKILLRKAVQRELLPNLNNILLSKPSKEIAAKSHQKYCYESCPERIAAEAHQKYCCQSRPEKLLPNINKILLRKLPREKTWDDSWQNQSNQDSRNQRLLNHSYWVVKYWSITRAGIRKTYWPSNTQSFSLYIII